MDSEMEVRLFTVGSEEVEDETLESWDREFPGESGSYRKVPARESDDPFDLAVAKPRAVSIERLYGLLGRKIPEHIQASLGANVPVLLFHNLTPFYKPGRRPTGIWGMGYQCKVNDQRCATVALFPVSRKYDVIHVSEQVSLGIAAGGEIGIREPEVFQALADPIEVKLMNTRLRATTDNEFAVAAECTFSVLEVQAGPLGAGGARWNLYRGRDSVETQQALFHSMLVPRGTGRLTFTIETWIRRSGRFFGLIGTRHWTYPAQTFQVSLEGLDG